MSEQTWKSWRPDGRGLSDECLAEVALYDLRVHLRLTSPGGVSAHGACDRGLGELWTGVAREVTCPDCLEVVHA